MLFFTTLLHGVEHLNSKILLQNGVERSSGVGVDPYTQYKTATTYSECNLPEVHMVLE